MAARRRPLTDAPELLEPDARDRIRVWARAHLPWGDRKLGTRWAECRDWHRAQGVLRADWEAAFRNWLRMEVRFQAQGGRSVSGPGNRGAGAPRRTAPEPAPLGQDLAAALRELTDEATQH